MLCYNETHPFQTADISIAYIVYKINWQIDEYNTNSLQWNNSIVELSIDWGLNSDCFVVRLVDPPVPLLTWWIDKDDPAYLMDR